MFVSRTRNSGTPCRSLFFGSRQKTSSATISTTPELGLQPFLEGDQKHSRETFTSALQRKGSAPSSALHPPNPQIFLDLPTLQLWITDSLFCQLRVTISQSERPGCICHYRVA